MYLKSLDISGFKSFANRTKLQFDPGMTAIVGPNGCGKSNISDAVRWVLGEQSAKALRGSKMEDVIFNGTDAQKPLSLAEVSLTLADCEQSLGVEYDEVTVTRRVLRSGEGQYFINKTPCRLKDIQRLFMDTGIGTNAYSLMEQGRIDLILSSRPEDRRAVFEEASGITKFKSDKKEAIRKLDQTEANLLRLADIIREVKRRIISLQRQAGKAKRYKTLQDECRSLDVFLSRGRLERLASDVQAKETRLAHMREQEEAQRADIHTIEQRAEELRTAVRRCEEEIATTMEAASRAASDRDRARQTIQVNRDRIAELKHLSERDSRDAEEARQRLATHQAALGELEQQEQEAVRQLQDAESDLETSAARLQTLEAEVHEIRKTLNRLRGESVDLESRASRLQNELSDLDAQERNSVLRRERLSAELSETRRATEKFEHRRSETEEHMASLREQAKGQTERVAGLEQDRRTLSADVTAQRETLNDIQRRMAAREAQAELYQQAEAEAEDLPPGARRLLGLDGSEALGAPGQVIGTLAEHLQAQPEYQKALEATLRAWLDAVVVADLPALQSLLTALNEAEAGSVRLLAATMAGGDPIEPTPDGPGVPLLDHVRVGEGAGDLAQRLLGRVRVVESLEDLALPLPPRTLYVTRQGAVLGAEGRGELWQPGTQETNPLTRRHLLDQWTAELRTLQDQRARLEQALQQLAARDEALGTTLVDGRRELEALQRSLALCEGEHQVKAEEAKQAQERMETVSFELNALVEQQSSSGDRRQAITQEMEQVRDRHAAVRQEIVSLNEALHHTEETRGQWLSEVTDKRVLVGERRQAVARCTAQRDDLKLRMDELNTLIQERHQGVDGYARRIEDLQTGMTQAESSLQPLEEEVQRQQAALQAARNTREEHTVALRHIDSQLHERRSALDELRNQRGQADVELAEQRMRRQNIVDRLSQDYHLTPEQLGAEPDPEWPEGVVPDQDTLETQIMEIRTKLESMGPVNLIAIEEHEELEERFQFLTTQQDDLVKAKTQLLDMIRRINQTTTEMFTRTFEQVNENFQETFKQLFAGGSAKLVLVDDAEVLESGIEIIARPPGKKLQSVSLLSGGERTMTAVALLFALYMVKPSPFCLLDELDAALDEANISRFVNLLERFRERSQFVVITHNRKTIEAADALYGVTMEKFGISKIMSMRFQPRDAQAETTEPTPPEAPPETQPEEAVTT